MKDIAMNEEKQAMTDDRSDIYANSVHINANIYEFTLEFELNTITMKGVIESRRLVRIRMSPQLAKALSVLLNKHLELYGELFHEIFLPEELVKRLSEKMPISETNEQQESEHLE